jgi:hypothetical protein
MDERVQKILSIWHKHFEDEEKHYSEFEPSDIEYFVACMLYNHFAFSKALETMKTIDLSYDFLSACGDEYDEIKAIIATIKFDTEEESVAFLQKFITDSRLKYTEPELYLLNRINYHINTLAQRYVTGDTPEKVDFEASIKPKTRNPLWGI